MITCIVPQGAGDAPVKVFDRTPNLAGAQIISYRLSPDTKWCVLIGITQGPPERCVLFEDFAEAAVAGRVQQLFGAHCGTCKSVKSKLCSLK